MVPYLTTVHTGALLELEASFLAVSLKLRRTAPMENELAEEEPA